MLFKSYELLWFYAYAYLCKPRMTGSYAGIWRLTLCVDMRAYDALCASTLMQCYDSIDMLAYACLCRSNLMHWYDVLFMQLYAALWKLIFICSHMRAYVKTCMRFYAVRLLCVPRHPYAFQLGGPRIESHRIFSIFTTYMRFLRCLCCLSHGIMLVYAALWCLELGKNVGEIREKCGGDPGANRRLQGARGGGQRRHLWIGHRHTWRAWRG